MTADPSVLLAACRAALDVRAELARKATSGPWDHRGWVHGDAETETYGVWASSTVPLDDSKPPIVRTQRYEQGWHDAAFIAANSPDQVLADIESKRLILDGWEQSMRFHVEGISAPWPMKQRCCFCGQTWPCPDYAAALAGLSSMARALGVETER